MIDDRRNILMHHEMLVALRRAQQLLRHQESDQHAINHEINCVIKSIELILRNLKA